VCCIVLAVGIYFATKKEDSGSSTGSGSPGPAAIDPLQAILQGSQTLQGAEYDITAVKPVTFTTPTGPVNYTMAFWVKIDNQAGGWREIWRREGNGPNPPPVNGWARVPAFFISGNNEGNGPGRVHYVHGSTTDWNTHTFSSNFKATPGTWFHFAATVDSTTKKITAYVNGVLEPSLTPGNDTTTGTFEWVNQTWFNIQDNRGVKIKNWYFIPRVLAAADIAKLAVSPSPSSGTTSTYMPEPIGYDKSESAN